MGLDINVLKMTARALFSTPVRPDGNIDDTPVRGTRYGALFVESTVPTKHVLADEGSYMATTNPTPGTALAYQIQAAFSATAPFIYLFNKNGAGGKRVYLDYLK